MFVIGTAGHVDHGKSTLVEALTGIDPDRLQEEKAREMTIDLGFAWLALPGLEEEVGVIDVPGHRDFIENMLAGVGGIDLALLVIAADEGVMPQTHEHLAILDLLQVKSGLIAVTKTDMVDDPDWLELVQLDISEQMAGTVLADAPLVLISAKTGAGLDELRGELVRHLQAVTPQANVGRARLPIDRVFSVSGFGTVVTGTLLGGQLQVGQRVEIQPTGLHGRVRGLQTHQTKRDTAVPGSRVAVNITGVDKDDLQRGHVLTAEGVVRPTILIDTQYRHLPTADKPFKHNQKVKLFVGSAEVLARARVLGTKEILPGETGWVQFALREPLAVLRGDRFIVRRPSPPATIGGGVILDPHPGRQHRRFHTAVLDRLQTLAEGTPGDLLLQKLARTEPANLLKFQRQSGLDESTFTQALDEVLADGRALQIGNQLITQATFQQYQDKLWQLVRQFHTAHPLRLGLSREEARSRLKLTAVLFEPLIEASGLVADGVVIREADHTIRFSPEQQARVDALLTQFGEAGIESPSVKDVITAVGEEVYYALIDLTQLIALNDSVVYTPAYLKDYTNKITAHLHQHGQITAGDVRDLFDTSRKYAIALLEYLDQQKVTRRVGDARVLLS